MDVLIFFAIISLFVTVYTIFVSAQLKRERREIINRFNDVELNRYLEERYFTDQLIGLAPHQKLKLAESSVNDRIRISRRLSTSSFSIFIFVLLFTSVSTYKSSRSEVEGDVAKLVRGKIAYHIPDTMTINQPEEAFVSVSKSVNDSVLLSDISDTAFQKDSITVSSRMIL